MSGDLDHRNVQQDWSVRPGVNMEFARSTFIGTFVGENFERFGVSTSSPAGNNAPFLGRGNEFQGTLTLRPISRLKLDEIYYMTRLHTNSPRTEAIFLNHLVRSRANYQFQRNSRFG